MFDRLYWNLRPVGAPLFLAAARRLLDGAALPFRIKVLSDPRGLRRCDTAVLYTQRRERPRTLALAAAIRRVTAPAMRDPVPALTLRLAPGLGFAEDPGGGLSYGAHRSRILGAALVRAWEARLRTGEERMRAVEQAFHEAGLDLSRPHLGVGSSDDQVLAGFGP